MRSLTNSSENARRVLILAPIGRDATATAELLGRTGIDGHSCDSLAELLVAIEQGAAAVLITEEALAGQELSPLSQWVMAQPPWSDLPFIVLTAATHHQSWVIWRQQLLSLLRNVSLLERPVRSIALLSTVQSAVRARQRQYQLRSVLEQLQHASAAAERLVMERTRELEAANRALQDQFAERARIEEALRQTQKIEAIGQLTGGVAHDFNNLLMVITGGLEMLRRRCDPEQRTQLMDGMQEAAQRGASLTRQLLAFSRTQALQPRVIDLDRQLGGMRELLERSLRGDVKVALELAADLWPVELDANELELAILNLAVNARDAMPQGGTIRVRAENLPEVHMESLHGDFVGLSIIDTGIGMSADVQARVFEPFFTTKEIGKGSGLGLAQVYGFIRQSGGTVRIQSAPGCGTSVTLLLPRSRRLESPAASSHAAVFGVAPDTGSAGSALMVEDNDAVAALVGQMLREVGYDVIHVSGASAALDVLANGQPFDIVFSDILMPGDMDGVELARQIRARRPGLPVVLTSGFAGALKETAESEGFAVLLKPYDLAQLSSTLQRALQA